MFDKIVAEISELLAEWLVLKICFLGVLAALGVGITTSRPL